MSEHSPEFSMEVPGLRVEVFLEEGPELDDRERTMRRIIELVEWGDYAQAQALVEESGIKYSEAVSHFRKPE